MNIEKETWKNKVMESLDGINPAEPNPFLFTRIESRLVKNLPITGTQLRWAALALIMLLAINITALRQSGKTNNPENNSEYNLSGFNAY